MSNHEFFLKIFTQPDFPQSDEITERATAIYEAGQRLILTYRGDYRDLIRASQFFLATNCRPYALLGAAQVLTSAAYVSGSYYEPEGLNAAQRFVDQARELSPLLLEVEFQQGAIYKTRQDNANLKRCLDALSKRPEALTHFSYALMQMNYWEDQKDIAKMENWHRKAIENATSDIERVFALNRLASVYMMSGNYKLAVAHYQQVVKLDPTDPWAWHNMSWMMVQAKDYNLAGQYNRNALNLMEFGNAFMILDKLVDIWRKKRHPSLINEVPRYLSQEQNPSTKKDNGFFGRLFGG